MLYMHIYIYIIYMAQHRSQKVNINVQIGLLKWKYNHTLPVSENRKLRKNRYHN